MQATKASTQEALSGLFLPFFLGGGPGPYPRGGPGAYSRGGPVWLPSPAAPHFPGSQRTGQAAGPPGDRAAHRGRPRPEAAAACGLSQKGAQLQLCVRMACAAAHNIAHCSLTKRALAPCKHPVGQASRHPSEACGRTPVGQASRHPSEACGRTAHPAPRPHQLGTYHCSDTLWQNSQGTASLQLTAPVS